MIGVRDAPQMNESVSGQTDEERERERAQVQLAANDAQQFAPLYARYFEPVYGYCYRRLRDPHRAADVTSQVFLKALASLDSYRGGSFRSWLFTIARNEVVDSARRLRPQTHLPSDWQPPDPQPSPEQATIALDERRRLWELLDQLTEDQREVVELRLAGLTGQEIADQMGRSLSATKSLQVRAFARLRLLLELDQEHPKSDDISSSSTRWTS